MAREDHSSRRYDPPPNTSAHARAVDEPAARTSRAIIFKRSPADSARCRRRPIKIIAPATRPRHCAFTAEYGDELFVKA